MDGSGFDALTRRWLGLAAPRRQTLFAPLLGTLFVQQRREESAAGPGCKNVGKKCQNKKDCCSGVCKGKKGKKRCREHGADVCQAGQQAGICGGPNVPCTTSTGQNGVCETTTGNGGYCTGSGLACMSCHEDRDCRDLCGPDAACIRCGSQACPTACVGPQDCE